jgi:hypothetical protein
MDYLRVEKSEISEYLEYIGYEMYKIKRTGEIIILLNNNLINTNPS